MSAMTHPASGTASAPRGDATAAAGSTRGRSVLGWMRMVLCWMFILATLAVLASAVLVPRLAGATPYTVLTGSMRPNYPPGTLVVDKPVAAEDVQVGDVVTYQLVSGEPTVVTHRVIGIGAAPDGDPQFLFQGDANDTPDAAAVQPEQLRGRLWYAVPYVGRVNTLITGNQRQIAVYIVAGGLAVYAGTMFAGVARDRRRRRLAPAAPAGRHAAN